MTLQAQITQYGETKVFKKNCSNPVLTHQVLTPANSRN